MSQPRVVMCSMFKDDADRQLVARAWHLLAKADAWPNTRFVWVVGDSDDDTAEILRRQSAGYDVTVVDIGSTGIEGDDAPSRLRRLSVTANHYWRYCDGADYVMLHESDIVSPPDLIPRLVANAERGICPVAAWPTIKLNGKVLCYDVWALRKDGVRFSNKPPYHQCYKPDRPFTVDSAGTVLMFHGEDVGSVLMDKRAVLDLCWHLRQLGRDIWVDPTLVVEQPHSLWTYQHIDKEYA